MLLYGFRCDVVFLVVGLLQGSSPMCFIYGSLHGVGDFGRRT